MSLLGDLGNVFHSIGHFFTGGNNNNQNNQPHNQPVVVHPALTGPVAAPNNNNQNRQNNNQNSIQPQHQWQPQQNNNQQQPQQQAPLLQLYQGSTDKISPDSNPLLVKAPNTSQQTVQPSKPHASILHDITHNPVTNALGTGAKDVGSVAAGTSLGVLRAGEGLVQGVTDIPKLAVDAGTWAGDKLSGTNVRPQFVKNVDQWTSDVDKPQQWLQKKTDEASQAYGQLGSDVYKPVQIATNVATAIPAAAAVLAKVGQVGDLAKVAEGNRLAQGAQVVTKGADAVNTFMGAQRAASPAMQLLDKVNAGVSDRLHGDWGLGTDNSTSLNKMGTATDTKVAAGVQRPDEVTTGISSVNPNQGADALKAIQQKEAEDAAQAQAAMPTKPTDQVSQPASTPPQSSSTPPQIEPVQTANSGPEPAPTQASAISPQSQPQASPQTLAEPIQSPETVSPSQGPPISNTPNNVAQTPHDVNAQPGSVPSAPNVIAQLKSDLQTAGAKAPKIDDPTHDALSNEDLNQAANRYVQAQSDEDLLKSYSTGANVRDAQSLATAVAATKRLGELSKAGVEGADQAIENILDGAAQSSSGAGRVMNYVQSMYDSLPQPAKVKYLVRSIDKSREAAGLSPLSDQEAATAEQTIDHFLTETENANNATASAEGEIQAIKDKIGTGQLTQDDINKIAQFDKVAKDSALAAQKTQGDLARAYDQYAPQPKNITNFGNSLGNMGRSLMLTSVSGRVSDVATTSMNMLHTLTQNAVEAGIGKIANAVRTTVGKTPGKYIDTLPSGQALLHGTGEGLQKAGGNFRGDTYVTDVQKAIKTGSEGGKTQLARAGNNTISDKVRNFSHAMAETATNLSNGVKNTKILQLAYQEGKAKGLSGLDLDVYAHSTAALPTRQMAAKGEQLVEELNNMNDNPFTHGLENVAKGLDKIPVIGEQVRNLIAPFNRWVGGQMWNGITDKNVVANVLKMGKAMIDGDSQEAVHQLAGVATNTLGTMSAGYALASSGVLTTKNGAGFNDDGLYLHLGGHFIPVSFFGFAAPGMIMGWATHQAFNDKGNGSIAGKIMHAFGTSMATMGHAYLGNTLIGGGSELVNQIQDAIQSKSGVTGKDVAATAGTDAVGNYVPGAAGDVNSAINTFNIGGLNPSHDAALTKVTQGQDGVITKTGLPSKSKNIPRTDLNQLLNKIPVLGQKELPRNPGVAANDFGSRITRGDNQSAQQVKDQYDAAHPTGPAAAKAQLAADKAKFIQSNKTEATINGKVYTRDADGGTHVYNNQQELDQANTKAKQAEVLKQFKDSKQDFMQKDGMVYQKGSDGKVTVMEQKDYDYKQAADTIKSAKESGDLNGTLQGQSKLLDNIQWQLNHADLTSGARENLVNTAANTQADFNKYQLWGDFTKPKGAPTYKPTFTGGNAKSSTYIKNIKELGVKYGLDVNALLSVASAEGLGGGVGDGGHAFGPFQMNDAGGVLTGRFTNSQQAQAYAESPQGIEDAIKQIANVAKGKIGPDAVKAIVTQFERPADPNGEIARALSVYEGGDVKLPTSVQGNAAAGSISGDTSITPGSSSSASASKEASLIKENVIGNLPVMARESFIENGLTAKPVTPNIPQIKLTAPDTLIKAHRITVGMPKA